MTRLWASAFFLAVDFCVRIYYTKVEHLTLAKMITLKELGNNTRQIRERLGFSQEHVAEYLGLSRQAIISIEAGKRKIDSFELFKLADLFGVDAKELLAKEEVKFSKFEDAVLHLRKKERLSNQERQALIGFQQICEDYEFLKKL